MIKLEDEPAASSRVDKITASPSFIILSIL